MKLTTGCDNCLIDFILKWIGSKLETCCIWPRNTIVKRHYIDENSRIHKEKKSPTILAYSLKIALVWLSLVFFT